MWANNRIAATIMSLVVVSSAQAQVLTAVEASQKQSEIARYELDARLEEMKRKIQGTQPVVVPPMMQEAKEADELLSLISVYGVGKNLKADFLFRGTVITLSPGSRVGAVGWILESLTPTQAVVVKKDGRAVVRRSTLYLTGLHTENLGASRGSVTQPASQPATQVPQSQYQPAPAGNAPSMAANPSDQDKSLPH